MSTVRSVHFRPPEPSPELLNGHADKSDKAEPSKVRGGNPIDALGEIGRDVSLLHQMAESLVRDPEGRHGHLHVMRRALFRLQENVKLLITLEER